MKMNEGTLDRVVRVILGGTLISQVFMGLQSSLGWVGVIPLLTGVIGFCPIYKVFNLQTCPLKVKH